MKRVVLLLIVMVVGVSDASARVVQTETGFQKAVTQGGGVIVLRAGSYRTLAVTNRAGRWLTIRARPGVTVRNLIIRNAARVRVVNVRVKGGRLNIHSSRQVKLERVRLVHSRMSLAAANFVTIKQSQFTRCGENREACLATGWGRWKSSHLRVISSRFFDCYGCDFIRGHIGTGFTLRGSSLVRAVPGPCGTFYHCNHQDGVQMTGNNILIEGNRFGLTFQGAGQLYFSKTMSGLTIRNNVFFGTDATLPDYIGWAAIVVGNHAIDDESPRNVAIVNNTILTGAQRPDGLANSVILSPWYSTIPVEERPLIANNVLGLLRNPERLCVLAGIMTRNIMRDADAPCSENDSVADPGLDEFGHPLENSTVIDQADPAWAPPTDLRGWARDANPDIGAFEFVR